MIVASVRKLSVPDESDLRRASDAGMAFSAQYADFNFCFGKGVNTPTAFALITAARMKQAARANRARRWFLCVVYGDCR